MHIHLVLTLSLFGMCKGNSSYPPWSLNSGVARIDWLKVSRSTRNSIEVAVVQPAQRTWPWVLTTKDRLCKHSTVVWAKNTPSDLFGMCDGEFESKCYGSSGISFGMIAENVINPGHFFFPTPTSDASSKVALQNHTARPQSWWKGQKHALGRILRGCVPHRQTEC